MTFEPGEPGRFAVEISFGFEIMLSAAFLALVPVFVHFYDPKLRWGVGLAIGAATAAAFALLYVLWAWVKCWRVARAVQRAMVRVTA